jgi:hypothetical protein
MGQNKATDMLLLNLERPCHSQCQQLGGILQQPTGHNTAGKEKAICPVKQRAALVQQTQKHAPTRAQQKSDAAQHVWALCSFA